MRKSADFSFEKFFVNLRIYFLFKTCIIYMPYVSMFFGIIIRMFYNDHSPPHFHAEYQGTNGMFSFKGEMIEGNIKSKIALKLIKQWAKLRTKELEENWDNIQNKLEINKIAPID